MNFAAFNFRGILRHPESSNLRETVDQVIGEQAVSDPWSTALFFQKAGEPTMPIAAFAQKKILDWMLGGAVGNPPAARWVGLSLGTPTSIGGSELNTSLGYARQTVLFSAAKSGSASNTAAMSFGPFSSIATVLGVQLWDASAVGSGDMWLVATLQTPRTLAIGHSLLIVPGGLNITLA